MIGLVSHNTIDFLDYLPLTFVNHFQGKVGTCTESMVEKLVALASELPVVKAGFNEEMRANVTMVCEVTMRAQ